MRKKRYLLGIFGILIGTAGITGASAAYLQQSTEMLQNVITAGSVKGELLEPNWKEASGTFAYPGKSLEKDPMVKNTGENSAAVFLEIVIPMENISVVDENTGKKTEKQERELFYFQPKDGWELISRSSSAKGMTYVYGYQRNLEPGEITEPLFEKVTLVPYLEGELSGEKKLEIPVTAKVIQAQNLEKSLKEIYQEYLNQEKYDKEEET